MRKSDIMSVTVYEIYGQRSLTAQIERVQYKCMYVPCVTKKTLCYGD